MSKVDVILPQERLSSPQKVSPNVVRTVEKVPSSDEFLCENNKHPEKIIFPCKRDSDTMGEGESDRSPPENKRKKHRRGKRRKWKPYSKMTWEERRELEERDSKKAIRVRAAMSAQGRTLAPYNTTQFLMEDHNVREPDYDHILPASHRHRENSNSMDSSDEFYSSPEDEEDFLQKQFTEEYEDIHVERLNSMSKNELVQELMCMEDRAELLQKRLENFMEEHKHSDTQDCETQTDNDHLEEQLEKIRVFREEIFKLTEENHRLRLENEELRLQLPGYVIS